MYAQGKSLGRQLKSVIPSLKGIIDNNPSHKVWFMGRDCDVFFLALKDECKVGYITGLNRDNARKLAHRGKLSSWLRSIGVKDGDILIDSGYSGSIFKRILDTKLSVRCILISANPEGHCGEPLDELSYSTKVRSMILALEHSPKMEIVEWDEHHRRPKVTKLSGRDRMIVGEWYKGVQEGIMD